MAKQYHLPTSYAEVYEHYHPMMVRMVSEAGIRYQDVPDVAMELLTTFMAKDGLSLFDVSRVTQPGTEGRLFHAMLRGFTSVYVRKYLDYQKRDLRKISQLTPQMITGEEFSLSLVAGSGKGYQGQAEGRGAPSLALAAGLVGEWGIEPLLESQALSEDIQTVLRMLRGTNPQYDWDGFVESVSDRALDDRKLSNAWLGRRLGVSPKTAKRMTMLFQNTYLAVIEVAA